MDHHLCKLLPLPDVEVNSGFTMDKNAFRFPNFAGRDPDSTMTTELMQRMYGKQAVCASEYESCRLRPAAKEFQRLVNLSLQGGRCEGFAILSDLMFEGRVSPLEFGAEGPSSVDLVPAKPELAYWFATQYLYDVIRTSTRSLDAEGAVRFLAAEFSKPGHGMYRMGIFRKDDQGLSVGGHAIVPMAVIPEGGKKYVIKVYDNNHPEDARDVRVDVGAGTWEYQASTNPANANALYQGTPSNGIRMIFAGARPRVGQHQCGFCTGTVEEARQVLAGAGLSLNATDDDGRNTGEVDGNLVAEIPDSLAIPVFSADSYEERTPLQLLLPPGSKLKLAIRTAGPRWAAEPAEVRAFSRGQMVGASDVEVGAGQQGSLEWDHATDSISYQLPTPGSVTLMYARANTQSQDLMVTFKLPPGGDVTRAMMTLNVAGNPTLRVLSAAGAPTTAHLTVTRSSATHEEVLEIHEAFPSGGSAEVDVASWGGEGSSVEVRVDNDGDGVPDETRVSHDTGPAGLPPSPPADLVATALSHALVQLAWTDNATSESGFEVQRDSGGGFVTLATMPANTTSFDDATVVPAAAYVYRLRSVNPYGQSDFSAQARVTVPCPPGGQDNDGDGVCATACSASACSGHGTCSDVSGLLACSCDTGYAGPACATCAADHQDNDGDQTCLPACVTDPCHGHGACNDDTGTPECVCDTGYTGPGCAECAVGYQDNDGNHTCVAACAPDTCSGNGRCVDDSGSVQCLCYGGWAPPTCGTCPAGLTEMGGACVGRSCAHIKGVLPLATSGIYSVMPSGSVLDVYCDMETDGGGWTLVSKFTQAGGVPFGDVDQAFWDWHFRDADWMLDASRDPPTSPEPDYLVYGVESMSWGSVMTAGGNYHLRQHFFALDHQDEFDVAYGFTFNGEFLQDRAPLAERSWQLRDRRVFTDTTGIAWDTPAEQPRFWPPFTGAVLGSVHTACNGYAFDTGGCDMLNPVTRRYGNAGIVGALGDLADPAGAWAPCTEPDQDLVTVHQAPGQYGRSGRDMVLMYWLREVPSCASASVSCPANSTCQDDGGVASCACTGVFLGPQCDGCPLGQSGPACTSSKSVSSGASHGCALVQDGVACWGSSAAGALGVPDQPRANGAPLLNLGPALPVQVSAGSQFNCAVLDDDTVRCWGSNDHLQARGEAGPVVPAGLADPAPAPLPVGGPVRSVVTGSNHVCALRLDGGVRCWGANGAGECGVGNATNPLSLALSTDVDLGAPVAQVCAGASHSCALTTLGDVYCWGQDQFRVMGTGRAGHIGDNESVASVGPVPVVNPRERAEQLRVQVLACGGASTCVIMNNGAMRCFGENDEGELGYGSQTWMGDDESVSSLGFVNVGAKVVQAALGDHVTCALLETGSAKCWGWTGRNPGGCLGHGSGCSAVVSPPPASTIAVGAGLTITELGTRPASSTVCARLSNHGVKCWSGNTGNACGLDTPTNPIDPPAAAYSLYLPDCGDSIIGYGEECDDGAAVSGDGCSDTCQLE
jgi:cysteine-rich repeat protein